MYRPPKVKVSEITKVKANREKDIHAFSLRSKVKANGITKVKGKLGPHCP